jgi:hypothetical protein
MYQITYIDIIKQFVEDQLIVNIIYRFLKFL